MENLQRLVFATIVNMEVYRHINHNRVSIVPAIRWELDSRHGTLHVIILEGAEFASLHFTHGAGCCSSAQSVNSPLPNVAQSR